MAEGRKIGVGIPIKYKFLMVLLSIMVFCLGVFFAFAYRTFSEDKKIFVMDLNLSLLKAATSEVRFGLRNRLEEVQILIPRVYNPGATEKGELFSGLSPTLKEEVLAVTFYRQSKDGVFQAIRRFSNDALLKQAELPETITQVINSTVPAPLDVVKESKTIEVVNRSVRVGQTDKLAKDVPILSLVFSGKFVDRQAEGVVIVVDFIQAFLQNALKQSDVAELFLVRRDGRIVSHPDLAITTKYAAGPLAHPIIERLKTNMFPRESLELEIQGEAYLCNVGETGFDDVFIVSQVRKDQAFMAVNQLVAESAIIMGVILCLSIIASIIFARRLTVNIEKLQSAAEEIGKGNLNLSLNIKSNDEIQNVAETFEWMSARLSDLIFETAKKARMEGELKTARLVQSTLLNTPHIASDSVEVTSHLVPATDLGGDFWDAYLIGNTLTILIGDATGHGAPAALVTAIAKSCFSTLNTVYHASPLDPEQVTSALNFILHSSCRGKLLMTMCIIQINLQTGEIGVCNAGHESPMVLRGGLSSGANGSDKGSSKAEVLFTRGERLGFSADAEFKTVRFQLTPGDVLMLYTDGITEAKSPQGKDWGERQLRKTFAAGGSRPIEIIKKDLVAAVESHMSGEEQKDDITFVLVKWKGMSASVGSSLGAAMPPPAKKTA